LDNDFFIFYLLSLLKVMLQCCAANSMYAKTTSVKLIVSYQ